MNHQDEAMNAAAGGHQSNVVNASGQANPSAANQVQAPNNAMAPGGGGQSHMANNQLVLNGPNGIVTGVQCDLYVPCTKQVLKNSTVYLKDSLKIKLNNVRPQIYRRLLPRNVIVKSSIRKYSMGLHFRPADLLYMSVSAKELSILVPKSNGGVKLVVLFCSQEDKNQLVNGLIRWTQFGKLNLNSSRIVAQRLAKSVLHLWNSTDSQAKQYYVNGTSDQQILRLRLTEDLLYEHKRLLLFKAHWLLLFIENPAELKKQCKVLFNKAYNNSYDQKDFEEFNPNINWDDPRVFLCDRSKQPEAYVYFSRENNWFVLNAIDTLGCDMKLICLPWLNATDKFVKSLKPSQIHFWRVMHLPDGNITLTIFYFNQPYYITIRWNSHQHSRNFVPEFTGWLSKITGQRVKEVSLDIKYGLVQSRFYPVESPQIYELFGTINHEPDLTPHHLKYQTLTSRLSKTKSASEKRDCRYRTHCAIAGDCKRLIRRAVNKLAFILVKTVAEDTDKQENKDHEIAYTEIHKERFEVYKNFIEVFQNSWYEKNAPLSFADSKKQTNRRGPNQLKIVEYEWLYGLLEETN